MSPAVWLAVAVGGALGSTARLAVMQAARALVPGWPWGTWAVNVLGSLAIGVLMAWFLARPAPDWVRIGLLTDLICCPGLDFCSLANAGSIGVAQDIFDRFDNLDDQHDVGPIKLKMSGCMNGCGHHTVGHIGILGVDKKGEEWYQVTLGGSADTDASLGDRTGPSFARDEIADAVQRIVEVYLELRHSEDESFLQTYRRVGMAPFKARLYPLKAAA